MNSAEHLPVEEGCTELLTNERTIHAGAIDQAHQLEVVFAAMTDAVLVFDQARNVVQLNTAARDLFQVDECPNFFGRPLEQRLDLLHIEDKYGQLCHKEELPLERIFRGEALQGKQAVDVVLYLPVGRIMRASVTGGPVRDRHGSVIGAVLVLRDITDHRQFELRVQKSFDALLTLVEELVRVIGQRDNQIFQQSSTPSDIVKTVGQHLAELTNQLLECRFVEISLLDARSEKVQPIAVAGLPADTLELIQHQEASILLTDNIDEETIKRLQANEVIVCNLLDPVLQRFAYGLGSLLVAPMLLCNELVGIFYVEKGSCDQEYTPEEIALVKAVAKLILLVIERERLQQEWVLSHANELALQESNRRFDEFLSIASHELRTPLTTIKGNIQLVIRRLGQLERVVSTGEKVPASQLERIRAPLLYAEHRVNVQNRMISDLLDVSRIQANELSLVIQPCSLAVIVRDAVEDQRYVSPERVISLNLPDGWGVPITADADRIGQVVNNYLTNALKYSPSDCPISVCLERDGAVARVSVRDEGPGLSAEEQQCIWERFYRARDIKVQCGSGAGLGLGLYICRMIIEYHGGQYGLQSTCGEGSMFWFTLPLAQEI